MIIDWTKTEAPDVADLAAAFGECAELDTGLPFALCLTAIDNITERGDALTRDSLLDELGVLAHRMATEALENG